VTVKAQMTPKGIVILEKSKLDQWKAGITPGFFIAITFEPWEERRSLDANAFWHELVGRYAKSNGYHFEYARAELKYLHGVKVDQHTRPPWSGRFVEIYDEIWFLKSTAEYNKSEFHALIEGTIQACIETGVDISDILEARYAER
jgi:hypothetical protein